MSRMSAYVARPGTDHPVLEDRPVPEPAAGQVLVRVRAAALNNGDLSAVSEPQVPGFEFSGEVVAAGSDAGAELVGSRVMGIGEGAFAEYVLAHHTHVLVVPEDLELGPAAALPTALSTEYGALLRAGLEPGATVLITAATSGIALHGIQVAKALGAASVIGTTRDERRQALLERAGADHVVITGRAELADAVRTVTGGRGADVVLDHVGGHMLDDAIQAAAPGGSVVSVGRLAGRSAEIDLFGLARRAVVLQSVSYGLTPPHVLGDLFAGVNADLIPAVRAGTLTAVLDGARPFQQLGDALDRLRSGHAQGKLTVELS